MVRLGAPSIHPSIRRIDHLARGHCRKRGSGFSLAPAAQPAPRGPNIDSFELSSKLKVLPQAVLSGYWIEREGKAPKKLLPAEPSNQ